MFLNILRISASNALKTFLNIIYWVYICCFPFAQTSRKHKYALLIGYCNRRQESIIINIKEIYELCHPISTMPLPSLVVTDIFACL